MTKKSLNNAVFLVLLSYFAAIVAAIVIRIFDKTENSIVYTTYKDLIPLLIAFPAAWLGYCIQRRNSYMQQLRILWSKLVEAIQHTNRYTFLDHPTKEQQVEVLHKLSVTIDEFRSVFMNLGERKKNGYKSGKGLYPFEPLKEIHKAVSAIGNDDSENPDTMAKLREEIFQNWKKIRDELLKEFDREEPVYFSSHFRNKH